jgi:FdhD protein
MKDGSHLRMTPNKPASENIARHAWRDSGLADGTRAVPEETAIALTYNGGTHAVMMATPRDLEDFAIGFSLAEGVVASRDEITSIDILDVDGGVELRMWLRDADVEKLRERRRQIAGPTGCGLCGVDSIREALRPAAVVGEGRQVTPQQVMAAMAAMAPLQSLNIETRAVHAAAFWMPARGIVALREDVGRHNALDKLSGALNREGVAAENGLVLLTSRVSVEMVQKAAAMGATTVVSVSAPTALAVRMAEAANITLMAVARADGFELFTHPRRILSAASLQGVARGVVDVA